jgi:hypothetical protein
MVVIAIAGASTSGKTTLTEWISSQHKCSVVELDRYFLHPAEMPHVLIAGQEYGNWETPESVAWDLFFQDFDAVRRQPLVIVEGFILFGHPGTAPLCDALITLKYEPSEMEIALGRRLRRGFGEAPPANYRDAPTESRAHFAAHYFERVAWPAMVGHPEYTDPPGWRKPRLALRATDDIAANRAAAGAFVSAVLDKGACLLL